MSTAAEDAKRYLHDRDIPTLFESLMTGLMYNKPDDHVQFMISCLVRLKQSPPDKMTWDIFVYNPPPIVDITGVVPIMNGHTPHPPPGNPPERVGSASRRRSGSAGKQRPGSKDRSKRAAQAAAVNGDRPGSQMEAIEERLSTPLTKVNEGGLPTDLGMILLFGGPGGARGQFSKKLGEEYQADGVIDIRMSELVHQAFTKYHNRYPEWREAKAMYDRGELLPDKISLALLKQEINSKRNAKYAILDGYPRTVSQVRDLEENGAKVRLAIILDFDEETLYDQTKRKGHGSATVNRRLQEFKDKTLPVAKYYDDKFLLHLVPGEQDEQAIQSDLSTLVRKLIRGELKPPTPQQVFGGRGNMDIPILLVVGAPGSLKSEYSNRIAKRYDGFVHLNMGNMIRDRLAQVGAQDQDPWSNPKLREAYDKGTMIDSNMCAELVQESLQSNPGIWGFVIDGFPRDLAQARDFETKVGRIDLVLLIDCTEQFCLANMEKRSQAPTKRSDDTEAAAKEKLTGFKDRTLPMLKYFDEKGKLRVVEGDRGVDGVIAEVYNILDTALFIPQDSGSGKSLS